MPNYACQHDGDGFYSETETHHGEYEVWVCAECGHEVPIDLRAPERLKRDTNGQHNRVDYRNGHV